MLKKFVTMIFFIAVLVSFTQIKAQTNIESRVDKIYQYARLLELKKLDSVKILADSILGISSRSDYALGKIRANLLATFYAINKFKIDTAKQILSRCDTIILLNPSLAKTVEGALVSHYKGEVAYRLMSLEEAENYAHTTIQLANGIGNQNMIANAYTQLGLIEILRANDFKALQYFSKSYKLRIQTLEDIKKSRIDLEQIATIYRRMGQYQKALEYNWKLVDLGLTATYYTTLINTDVEIGKLKILLNENDSALYYLNHARASAEANSDVRMQRIVDSALAGLYSTLGNYTKSNQLIAPLTKRPSSAHSHMAEDSRITISTNYFHLKKYDSALFYGREGFQLASRYGKKLQLGIQSKIISEIFEAKKNSDSALFYLKIHSAVNDSLNSRESQRKLSTLYADIETLSKQNEIELAIKESELQKAENTIFLVLLVGVCLMFTLVFSSAVLFYKNRKKHHKLKTIQLESEILKGSEELRNQALKMIHISNGLKEIEDTLKKVRASTPGADVNHILKTINISRSMEKEWETFDDYFGNIHSGFYEKLHNLFPEITITEKRLAGLVRMNLTNAEIARILNIEDASVKTAKYRLKKKLQLSEETNLNSFLLQVTSGDAVLATSTD